MMRSCKTFAVLGALLVPLASTGALAQEPDVRNVSPFVMLVVDSSGSMEQLPACECASESDCTKCEPQCHLANNTFNEPPKDTSGRELKKNRWAVTLEALTGKFVDFECTPLARTSANGMTYDEGYSIPYHQPWDCATPDSACAPPTTGLQLENGILDSYKETLRFGLMTFDGEYTYKGGDDLLNEIEFDDSLSTTMPGMWSYGGKKEFKYPGCKDVYWVDSGARGPTATEGALVSVGSNPAAVNTAIQETLLRTRPYGGTPIAASLTDLYHHLKNDVTDPYKKCRERYAILITDGAPDEDFRDYGCHCGDDDPMVSCGIDPDTKAPRDPAEFKCPYPYAWQAARTLVGEDGTNPKQIEKLFVLGMSVQDAEAREILDDIAEAGKTTSALQADDPNTLRSTLDGVFSPLLNPISRSVPGFATGVTGVQYQISTGFQVTASTLSGTAPPWSGLIERKKFVCNQTTGLLETPDVQDEDRFHKVILNQSTSLRHLYTALPPTGAGPTTMRGKLALGSGEGCDSGCSLHKINDTEVSVAVYDVATEIERTNIIHWMYGESSTARRDRKIGDIYHSSPTLVGPPIDEPADDAYTRFRDQPVVRERPLVLYVASNDGVLHAISVEDYPADGYPITVNSTKPILPIKAGEEFWGFVPPMVMPKLKQQLTSHQFNLDATPVVKDVFFSRTGAASETEYRTVLIMGMRGGGNGYFALDVTDPVNPPKFLWQFTDADMGKTYGQPEIVQATVLWPPESTTREPQTRAIAILPGGKGDEGSGPGCVDGETETQRLPDGPFKSWTNDDRAMTIAKDHRGSVQCWRQTGRALYFVDVETGRQIKKVFDTDSNPANGIWFPSPITGTPTAYQDAVGTLADRGYVIDADGVIWRIDMSSTDPVEDDPSKGWTVRPFHDVFYDKTGEPSLTGGSTTYERPILSLDDKGRVVVIVGTGDTDNFEKEDADNRVVSLTEVTSTADANSPDDYHALINWELRNEGDAGNGDGFYPGELVTGSMALFEGQLFIASFISNAGAADMCEYGYGRLWSVHYVEKDMNHKYVAIGELGVANDPVTRGPRKIPVDDDSADTDASLFNVPRDRAEPNLLIQGLGTTQRNTCTKADDPLDTYFGDYAEITQTEPPAIWVVAQASGGNERSGSRLGGIQAKIERRPTFSRVTSWASSVD